jgi:hypothetical protein
MSRIAIDSINARMGAVESRQPNMEHELRDIRRSINETRVELKTEIMANTARIDEINK